MIEIIKTLSLIGNLGNSYRFNKKDEVWEMINPTTKCRKNDLVFPGRPFSLKDKATGEITGWAYELSFYPDDTSELPIDISQGPMKVVVFNTACQHIEGVRPHPETGEPIVVPQLARGMKVKITGGYYTKRWVHKESGEMLDHCLQVTKASDIVVLPKFQRWSPFEIKKLKVTPAEA